MLLAAIVAVPVAVWAAGTTNTYNGNVDRQRAKFRRTSIVTSSTAWTDVPGFAVTICAVNEASATLSVNLKGAAVSFRVLRGDGTVWQPGPARFDPSGFQSFSYTFVTNVGSFGADDHHSLRVQWRSATGGSATMTRGDLNVLYERGLACS